LFLKPSIIEESTSLEMTIPVVGHSQTSPRPGIYYFSVRLGVLDCENTEMSLIFMLHNNKPGQQSPSKVNWRKQAVTVFTEYRESG
jgi:hypothetical protein